MYESLALIYDEFTDDIDYDRWTDSIEKSILECSRIPVTSVLDLACGTGSFSLRLAKRGYVVTGIDISEEMLLRAGENARKAGAKCRFVRQDIASFSVHKPVDAIICACDGINYLLEKEQLEGFFQSCKAALKPGGVIVCDISSEDKLKNTLGNNGYFDVREDACFFWQNHISGRFVDMELNIFLKDKDGKYIRRQEFQRQRIYSKDEIIEAAKGFKLLGVENVAFDVLKQDKRIQFIFG